MIKCIMTHKVFTLHCQRAVLACPFFLLLCRWHGDCASLFAALARGPPVCCRASRTAIWWPAGRHTESASVCHAKVTT